MTTNNRPAHYPQPASRVPEVLPCPMLLEPGMRFGKGVRTQTMLDALQRRAEYHAELEAMTPEQRAEHEAGIAEFKSMLSVPAPGVPDDGRDQFEEWFKFHYCDEHSIVKLHRANGGANYRDPHVDLAWIAWKDSRAAMLQGKSEPVSEPYKLPVIGWLRSDFNSDDRRDPNAPLFVLGSNDPSEVWKVKYIPLTGNSPVIPDGWVMVPVEPTQEMIDAHVEGVQSGGMQKGYRAMLAAAPDFREISNSSTKHFRENAETSTNGWIPCSEQIPEESTDADGEATCYLVLYADGKEPNGGSNVGVWNVTYLRRWWAGFITHWQPLPTAPRLDSAATSSNIDKE